ncbi:MAG TPA: malto-oligosyltrehalose trehalohydrolase [Usitatibacter sp.]|nr:malto-oligosyltrehalose trehalohydrolase [Usitatibacter sp.]
MKRRHQMPFGAQFADAATRFRLWAPGVPSVTLELGRAGPRKVPMQAKGEGWYEALVEGVRPGEAYAFRTHADSPAVPDPASRSNPWDVNEPSAVIDPGAYAWKDGAWRGRPWHEAVVYELHLGTFSPEGTYLGAIGKLDHLVATGVTALEIMPVADFRGRRNWGYDGVLQYAPDAAYGTPEDLKQLVDAAHARGLMVLLDVVYNHFGPEGNYLSSYAPQFFNAAHQTPWGAAINFDAEHSRTVRDFFIHNALYWIEEFRFDGLRMDAIHAIVDESPKHIVAEIAEAVATGPGRERQVHVVLENDQNNADLLARGGPHRATAQWNDDSHHGFHVLLTGERDGYYQDYASRPAWYLGRTLAEGYGYQGEPSPNKKGERRGQPSTHLPLQAFVCFLQNHDQVGNRALGERLAVLAPTEGLRLGRAALLLAPWIPLLFMGDEFGAKSPFLFFCDYEGDLATAVREGRRKEFGGFAKFADPEAQKKIPDPNAEQTFLASKLPWSQATAGEHAEVLAHHRELLALRAREIVPRIARGAQGRFAVKGATGIAVDWVLGEGSRLHLRANFGPDAVPFEAAAGERLHAEGAPPSNGSLPGWSGIWTLERA